MNLTVTNDISLAAQVAAINRFSKLAIWAIWLAGVCCITVFVVFFFFYLNNTETAGQKPFSTKDDLLKMDDKSFFADKTTLVNIGLRMQEISGTSEEVRANGSITIHKIKYDQQIHTATHQSSKPLFYIKPIPK